MITSPTSTSPTSIRRAMFNQGCPMSANLIHSQIHQGRQDTWPSVEETQQTLNAMEIQDRVQRVGSERWGYAYWLVPLEGFER